MGLDSKPSIVDMGWIGLSGVGERRESTGALFMLSSSGMCRGDK